jgi:uncharacterized protein (DUF2141 family)
MQIRTKILFLIIVLFSSSAASIECSLQINIKGLKSDQGQLMIAVYFNEENFPDHEKTDRRFVYQLSGKNITNLKLKIPGFQQNKRYALAIYHDANSNNELDKNFLGLPMEIYTFSNNARGVFGPPTFEEASFELEQRQMIMTLDLE